MKFGDGPTIEFDWDEANIRHVARHNVRPAEVQEVLAGDPLDLGFDIVSGEDRYVSIGPTAAGRMLVVVTTMRADRVRVVTAFEPIKRLVELYYRRRGN